MNKVIVIAGPTATGKTRLSILLAKRLNSEIISCDSVQLYKGMDIGSAKVTKDEMDGIPHHMIDIVEPKDNFSVADFKARATDVISRMHEEGKIPILVGGTGFYIDAVVYDTNFGEEDVDEEYSRYLDEYELRNGREELAKLLKLVDEESYHKIHHNNVKRIKRALIYYHMNGTKISGHNEEQKKNKSPYELYYFVIKRDRKKLYDDINKRVDDMLEKGLLEEVKRLNLLEIESKNSAVSAIGYKELVEYLKGDLALEEAINKIKQHSRNYAKRQMTWFRRNKDVTYIEVEGREIKDIVNELIHKVDV